MLYDFGGRSARVKRAENYMLSSGFEYNAMIKDTFLDINKAYFDLLSAKEVLKSAKTSEASFKKSYEESSKRYELGLVSLSDKLLAKTSYEESRLDVVQAENQVKSSQGKLAVLLNASPTTNFDLLKPKNDHDLTKLAMQDMSIDQMIEKALELRPKIKKAQKHIDEIFRMMVENGEEDECGIVKPDSLISVTFDKPTLKADSIRYYSCKDIDGKLISKSLKTYI
jgi:outer membrane protein